METFEKLVAEEFQSLPTDRLLRLLKEKEEENADNRAQIKELLHQLCDAEEKNEMLAQELAVSQDKLDELQNNYEKESGITHNLRKENEKLEKMYNDYVRDAEAIIEELRHEVAVWQDNFPGKKYIVYEETH